MALIGDVECDDITGTQVRRQRPFSPPMHGAQHAHADYCKGFRVYIPIVVSGPRDAAPKRKIGRGVKGLQLY